MSLLTDVHKTVYEKDGYFFVRKLFSKKKISLLHETAANDHTLDHPGNQNTKDNGLGIADRR